MAEDKFHCFECAGKGKARGYDCSTCDGEGNLKAKTVPKEEPKKKQKRK